MNNNDVFPHHVMAMLDSAIKYIETGRIQYAKDIITALKQDAYQQLSPEAVKALEDAIDAAAILNDEANQEDKL